MGKRGAKIANRDEAAKFANKVMKMAEDDTENQILELIRKDPSLGPKVLVMLQKDMLSNQAVNGDKIPSCINKWNLLGKDRCITLLQSLSQQLLPSVTEKWSKRDVETLLAFALDVEDSSALPSKKMSGIQAWVTTRASAVGDRIEGLTFTSDSPKKVDWDKSGVFEIKDIEGSKVIQLRLQNDIKVTLPAEFAAASSLSMVCNFSASKAMLKTELTSVSVAKIFKRGNVNLPMPLFDKTVSEAASSPRSSTMSVDGFSSPVVSFPSPASPQLGLLGLPAPPGTGSALAGQ